MLSDISLSEISNFWVVVVGLAMLFLVYYVMFVVKKPYVISGNPELVQFAYMYMPALNSYYWPMFWCLPGQMQTLVRGIWNVLMKKSRTLPYRREVIKTPDGGKISLDWMDNDDCSVYKHDERPTVILIPGMSGSSGEGYAMQMVKSTAHLGYRTVVFNNRGLGGSRLRTPRTFCVHNTDDIRTVVNHIRESYPRAALFAAGASAGGINLFHYLVNFGKDSHLNGAMIVSVLYEMFESTRQLETFPNIMLFNQTIVTDLHHDILLPNLDILRRNTNLDVDSILKARSVRQYHTRLTVPMFGYKDWKHYYRECNLTGQMHRIKIPTLFLNAANDPFTPLHSIPIEEMKKQENIILVLTSHGGHCGFMEGLLPTGSGFLCKVFSQFVDAIFKFGEDKS